MFDAVYIFSQETLERSRYRSWWLKYWLVLWQNTVFSILTLLTDSSCATPRIRLYNGLWNFEVSIDSLRSLYYEKEGGAMYSLIHIEFDIPSECFVPMRTDSKWTFSKVKIKSKSIHSVVFSPTISNLILN